MLLILIFGIYAIVKKKVFITRNWTLTGRNARNFGITVVITTLPIAFLLSVLLPRILPAALVFHPIGGRLLSLAIFAVYLLLLALVFEDDKPAPLNW
jgi:hypothetical protein